MVVGSNLLIGKSKVLTPELAEVFAEDTEEDLRALLRIPLLLTATHHINEQISEAV